MKAQEDAEDEITQIAFGNLCSEVIMLRNEALEKDKILLSLVERLKSSEARLSSLFEADQKIYSGGIAQIRRARIREEAR